MKRRNQLLVVELLGCILIFSVISIGGMRLFDVGLDQTDTLGSPTLEDQVRVIIPSTITSYDLVELDPLALRREVDAGQFITIPFGETQFELKLVYNNMLSANYQPENTAAGTYRGKVVGDPNSWVRLSLREGVISGIVHTQEGDYWIVPVSRYGEIGILNLFITYQTNDLDFSSPIRCLLNVTPSFSISTYISLGPLNVWCFILSQSLLNGTPK